MPEKSAGLEKCTEKTDALLMTRIHIAAHPLFYYKFADPESGVLLMLSGKISAARKVDLTCAVIFHF